MTVDIVVNARHAEISPQLLETTRRKVAQLERFAADAHTCEILVHLKGQLVKGVASGPEPPAALDLALDKVRQQMRKRHERRSGGLAAARRRSATAAAPNGSASERGESD